MSRLLFQFFILLNIVFGPGVQADQANQDDGRVTAIKSLKAAKAPRAVLNAGWTRIRVAGDSDVCYGIMDIRRLLHEGVLEGPRITGATCPLWHTPMPQRA